VTYVPSVLNLFPLLAVPASGHYNLAVILLIDNYDSFTYNLVQRIGEMAPELELRVVRNDKITAAEAVALHPDHVIVSPGPCSPNEAGVSNDIIKAFAGRVPLLGVCLGHQCIGHCFGMTVDRNYRLMHGKTSPIRHDGKTIFSGLSNPFTATRYHSLVITKCSFDDVRFEVSAWTDENEIMALRAKPGIFGPGHDAPLEGVQFHPESFLTAEGPRLLANFLGLPAPKLVGV
jgi:anthranilate synthase/aminodeoxychorismate synthase-like glutamine amidotransferase